MFDTDDIYSVYILTDGLVEDVYDGNSIEDAEAAFDDSAKREQQRHDGGAGHYGPTESTVVLLDVATQNIIREHNTAYYHGM